MLKWIAIVVVLIFAAAYWVGYLHGVALRKASLILGKSSLKMAYRHYLEHGYPTNYGNDYQVYLTTNVVAIAGTNYQCFLTIDDDRFEGEGVLSMTTNEVFIWQDARRGPKLIPAGYHPPLFPPQF